MSGSIGYREQTATRDDIHAHLTACDRQFSPPLSSRVELGDYAGKLAERAFTFEAWHESTLAGLVAAYFPDVADHPGFISNVSVLQDFSGRGMATRLMERCMARARTLRLHELRLEVADTQSSAIHLYRKFGFVESARHGAHLTMQLILAGTRKP